jgi:hypothetical protein
MKIENIIIWILFILTIIIVLWFIFGNSPTFEQTILAVAITFLFTIGVKIGGFGEKLNSIERKFNILEKSFIRLSGDFKKHINKIN